MSEDEAYQLSYSLTTVAIRGVFCLAIVGGAAWLIFLLVRSSILRRRQRAFRPPMPPYPQQPPYQQHPQYPHPPQPPADPPPGS
ncbi:hypothetical protein [Actinoplanes sp. NPDC049118]|uniref:hypothetical protein n=1 Tax=Actinoplanes sp. NPDC049118 TaxID=3155769 RepID=UPI0033F4984A